MILIPLCFSVGSITLCYGLYGKYIPLFSWVSCALSISCLMECPSKIDLDCNRSWWEQVTKVADRHHIQSISNALEALQRVSHRGIHALWSAPKTAQVLQKSMCCNKRLLKSALRLVRCAYAMEYNNEAMGSSSSYNAPFFPPPEQEKAKGEQGRLCGNRTAEQHSPRSPPKCLRIFPGQNWSPHIILQLLNKVL